MRGIEIAQLSLLAASALTTPVATLGEPLRVSEDSRHLVTSDGTAFLYLADTAWELFHKLDREDADHYLQDRADKGFTVIQAVILSELDGLRDPNAYGNLPLIDGDPRQPNEAFFRHVDYIVRKASSLGLQMALLPSWGDKVYSERGGAGPVVFDRENATIYGRFLGERYKGQDVIWILGGDRSIDTEEVAEIWSSMARGLQEGGDRQHLMSFHPVGGTSSARWFPDEQWLDFHMYQSGHSNRFEKVYAFAERHLELEPRKPFIEAEPAYEDIPVLFWEHLDWEAYPGSGISADVLNEDGLLKKMDVFEDGFFTDYDVRVHAYWNLLSGAAGYAYGNNAVWQMFSPGDTAPIPVLTDWKTALDRPGAQHMGHLRALFETRPFQDLRPDQSLVQGPNPRDENHVRAARSRNGSFVLAYMAKGQPVKLQLDRLATEHAQAWWFNPRDGSARSIDRPVSNGTESFTPPSSGIGNDWLLVVDAEGAFSAAPGQE